MKPIIDIRKNSRFLINTPNGYCNFEGIGKTDKDITIEFTFDNFQKFKCSHLHKILTSNGELLAKNLNIGDKILSKDNVIIITNIKNVEIDNFFDPINVNSNNNLYYASNIISHNSFLGSSYTLIEAEYIKNLKHKEPLEYIKLHDLISKSYHKFIFAYEDVKPKHQYVIGVDPAKMSEEKAGDNMTLQVLDVTSLPYKQVFTLNIKEGVSYLQLPQLINDIGNYYNEAYVFIENNEIGQEVANNLNFDYEYENVFFEKGCLAGFRTTKKTKKIGCNNLKILIENNKLIINDFNTISELSTFIKKKDSYAADAGYTDDLVLSLIASLFFMQRKEFDSFDDSKDMMEKLLEKKVELVEEDVPSVGFFEDGSEPSFEFDF